MVSFSLLSDSDKVPDPQPLFIKVSVSLSFSFEPQFTVTSSFSSELVSSGCGISVICLSEFVVVLTLDVLAVVEST